MFEKVSLSVPKANSTSPGYSVNQYEAQDAILNGWSWKVGELVNISYSFIYHAS